MTSQATCVSERLLCQKETVRLHLLYEYERIYFPLKAIAYMPVTLRNSRDIGAIIRERRRSRGLSQQALATAIGVSRLWVNQVEGGKPGAELGLVLRALNVLGVRLLADERTSDVEGPDLDAIVEKARRRQP
jgi:HTH-type transcriptional regulator / antitoxin HipB